MKCCGEERKTKFCPECGKLAKQIPCYALLDYVRKRHKEALKHYERWREFFARLPEAPERKESREGKTAKRKATADQWASWADALEKLIDKGKGHTNDT